MERAIRHSKKREAILAALRGTTRHPSAEWLYRQLKPQHPDLSLGTVYRNLSFFLERGLMRAGINHAGHARNHGNAGCRQGPAHPGRHFAPPVR